ncbi:hypothetical protein DDE18_10415 [Nocardioides gansuensis]|uniref:Methyltransferase type 11 domain-containing protein n=1 Tax=Nocardioides gansuensis TaxID=2138300 RepID=A0A2T8FAM0_9ACTN|nr:hypothetical protein DDE18_10415 [Nocardioides gansuensis]
MAESNAALLGDARLLEVGSYDVNGSMREVFAKVQEFVGVDLTAGPGVDVVAYGHEVADADGSFDATVSGECFEHDPHWQDTFANMVRLTRPGGLVAFTCASHGRPEHGTRRSDVTDSPGTQAEGLDYYRNLVEVDFDSLPLAEWFTSFRFWRMSSTFDLYFAGVRAGDPGARPVAALPTDDQVKPIARMLPLAHRLVRAPLRPIALAVRNEDRYQRIILPYWLALLRRSSGHHRRARSAS